MLLHCKLYGVAAPLKNLAAISIPEGNRSINQILIFKFNSKLIYVPGVNFYLPKCTADIYFINKCSRA